MIEPNLITLTEVARRLPGTRPGKHRCASCLWRWAEKGCRGARLQTTWIGGVRYTTWEWVQAFLRQANAPPPRAVRLPKAPSTARQKWVHAELVRMGVVDG